MKSRAAQAYISVVIAAGAFLFGYGIWSMLQGPWIWTVDNQGRYLFYLAIALLASAVKIQLPSVTGTMSMSFLFVLIGAAEFSLGETLLVGVLGMVVQTIYHAKKRPKAVQVVFSLASMACSVQIAYVAYRLSRLTEHHPERRCVFRR